MRYVLWSLGALLGSVAACGGKSAEPPHSTTPLDGGAAGATGTAGSASQAGGQGGSSVAGGTGGATTRAGAAAAGDASSSAGAGGSAGGAEPGGEAGAAGMPPSCSGCGPLEACGEGGLCVAKPMPLPAGFSIDATEVTRGQYAAWLDTAPTTSGQEPVCAWNETFVPDSACMSGASACAPDECARHPQVCIDFCDAVAYCHAVGKHLCGAKGGGPVAVAAPPDQSEWLAACTANGLDSTTLPFGACNDGTRSAPTTDPVGSSLDCQSSFAAYSGIFDLIGNVWEWENNCSKTTGATDGCSPRGLAYGPSAAAPRCEASLPATRSATQTKIGFRCCSG